MMMMMMMMAIGHNAQILGASPDDVAAMLR
jgi:hypothetical protein